MTVLMASPPVFHRRWWATRRSPLVLLSTRPGAAWVRSRGSATFGAAMNMPIDRPCGLKLGDVSSGEAARLMTLHDELVRCVVSPLHHPGQLLEIDIFASSSNSSASVALMETFSRAVLGVGVPSGTPRAFPHVVSNAKPPPVKPAGAAKARPILHTARSHKGSGVGSCRSGG